MVAEKMHAANDTDHAWWAALRHGGCLIAPSHLAEFFPDRLDPLQPWIAERLRRDVVALEEADSERLATLLDTVLETIVALDRNLWQKASAVDAKWSVKAITGETIKPRRVWLGPNGAVLPVFVADEPALRRGRGGTVARLGIGRGRRPIARVIEWLRKADCKIALVTNGRQWRLIHAGPDYDAWCEWDIALWFEEGEPGPQVTALRALLGPDVLTPPAPEQPCPLLAAIQATRRGQSELSSVLGERVRLAVECLIRDSKDALDAVLDSDANVTRRDVYVAACRIIMRCVVILFAEARDLLPRDRQEYHQSYGLQGLRELLDRQAGGHAEERLRSWWGAWPRILALFRLIYHGSGHEKLTILRYGGGLFQPGDAKSADPVLRALAALEKPDSHVSDATVNAILDFLTRTEIRVRQGRSSRLVVAPVDFSQLDTEYIGILYEGLLDYELRRVDDAVPMLFLNLGDQPALPLTRLEEMDDKSLAGLVEKLKQKAKPAAGEENGEDTGDDTEEDSSDDSDDAELSEEPDESEASDPSDDTDASNESHESHKTYPSDDSDETLRYRERAFAWARRAVEKGKLITKPRGKMTAEKKRAHEQAIEAAAHRLVARLILPGEYYLVRWGGTRKGSGTFYTKPALAGPTVRRTLEPLCYDISDEAAGESADVTPKSKIENPKSPEAILALKVCDPACGSGSFLVAALRYLTQALYDSLFAHHWLEVDADGNIVIDHPPDPQPGWFWECVHDLPTTADNPEDHIRARLKRVVVERCLYGVDIDPLAVELCRLALWVETMDPYLPFTFLDHKIKVGNSLVGCWFDRFQDYPAMAWEREGGDKNHTSGVHFKKDAWTKAIKKAKNEVVKPELARWIQSLGKKQWVPQKDGGEREVLATEQELPEFGLEKSPEAIHDEALAVFRKLHEQRFTDPDAQAQTYADEFQNNPHVQALRFAFDTWCSVWFWPADKLDVAPTPARFFNPPGDTKREIERLSREQQFFHWEIEFPDVFFETGSGFDAMVGNPPWEIQKPNSKEWFSNVDPLYRAYGKQEALKKQKEFFDADNEVEKRWLDYSARLKAMSNWTKFAGYPFGDATSDDGGRFSLTRNRLDNEALHRLWGEKRAGRVGYGDAQHPFRYQGSADINTYKMFLESAYTALRTGGRVGLVVPSGIYTDRGSTDLRTLFLRQSRWDWLFGFENREGIFEIHRSFKFCPVIVEKGGETDAIRAAFMHRDLSDWEDGERHVLAYPRERVEQFSPRSRAILEIRHQRDLEILEKMYSNGVLLGDDSPDGWGIKYAREFDMTTDSKLFPPRPWWEEKAYRSNEYGLWERPGEPGFGVTLYQGRFIGQFDFGRNGWVSGKGRASVWRPIPWENKVFEPEFLGNSNEIWGHPSFVPKLKLCYMRMSSATNARSMIASIIRFFPAESNVISMTTPAEQDILPIAAFLNSFAFDSVLRVRFGGLALDYHVTQEIPLPQRASTERHAQRIAALVLRINCPHPMFSPEWQDSTCDRGLNWRQFWALTSQERLRLRCILDAVVAHFYGLESEDARWILRDCDHQLELTTDKSFTRTLDPKGFWRVSKKLEPELRHTVLAQVAFHDLKEKGVDAFLAQNDGEGWMIPETLRLADYDLGHDDRAKQHQPVAPRLGPRFYDFQLEQSPEESWEECRRHAENIRLIRSGDSSFDASPTTQTKTDQHQRTSRQLDLLE